PARLAPRLGLGQQTAALGQVKNLALVQPALDADYAVGRVSLGETVIDIRAQRVQRKLSLQIPLGARDFRAVQAAAHPHLDSLAAEAQRAIDSLTHRTAECHALFELQRDALADKLRIQLRLVNFLNVDEDFALGLLRHVLLQLLDLGALAADDDAGRDVRM